MFVSVTFPLADFRSLQAEKCGRLDRPHWGSADPRATFARGFGAIHTRNKSGNGFVGENYYADCNALLKYPSQLFLDAIPSLARKILLYPVYRRFFFDGQFSGRFELGFRLNEATVQEVCLMHPSAKYDLIGITSQLLLNTVVINLLDRRSPNTIFHQASPLLRDGYIMSSTKQDSFVLHDVASVGSTYVGVGAPFVFIRSSGDTPLSPTKHRRDLLQGDGFSLFQTRSGIGGRSIDVLVLESNRSVTSESARERLARLFYSQIRAITFAHSYYLTKLDEGRLPRSRHLAPALAAMIDRIKGLVPVTGDLRDGDTCRELRSILDNTNVDVQQLADEIERRLKPRRAFQLLAQVFTYFDKKADKVIEAAAITATKQVLSSGP